MPVTTRRQRARQRAEVLSPFPSLSSPRPRRRQPPRAEEERRLSDGTIVQVTASATGKGKHMRWIYPEENSSARTPACAAQSESPTSSKSTTGLKIPPFPQQGKLITPTTSLQQIPASIQNAPKRRRVGEVALDSLVLVQVQRKQPLQQEDTIPWEKDLNSNKGSSSSSPASTCKVGPAVGQALGPHGTWLVDKDGDYIVHPVRKRREFNMLG